MHTPKLVISLDFELSWGSFDKKSSNKEVFVRTKKLIPRILSTFEEYEIAATWATVGFLFLTDWNEWKTAIPRDLPTYTDDRLSAYQFAQNHVDSRDIDSFFAPELVQAIINTPRQELASHTFSHYYCLANGQSVEQFDKDLKAACEAAERFSIKLRSLVFPRNQFNPNYLEICCKHGIQSVRTNPDVWYWRGAKSNLETKLCRTGDAYLPFTKKNYPHSRLQLLNGVLLQPASRFLRPHDPRGFWLNQLRLQRIKSELLDAAKHGKIYHIWWHPHNFGHYPEASFQTLHEILEYFCQLRDKYGMKSYGMADLYKKFGTDDHSPNGC